MSETGGPVYEGSSARPEKARPRIVEKVKSKIDAKINGVRKAIETRKNNAQEIQARTMDRYIKVVGSMNESMLKSAYKKFEPIVRLQALGRGIHAGVFDVSVKSILQGTTATLAIMTGIAGREAYDIRSRNKILQAIGFGVGTIGMGAALLKTPDVRPMHEVRRKIEDVKDFAGLKGINILNKIIGRKEAPIVTPA